MSLNIHVDDWLINNNNLSIISNLNNSQTVKISNNLERFWVKIFEINESYILGKIDNYLSFNDNYDYQDIVIFEKCNILDIYKTNTNIIGNKIK